jgi:hypothetical protein
VSTGATDKVIEEGTSQLYDRGTSASPLQTFSTYVKNVMTFQESNEGKNEQACCAAKLVDLHPSSSRSKKKPISGSHMAPQHGSNDSAGGDEYRCCDARIADVMDLTHALQKQLADKACTGFTFDQTYTKWHMGRPMTIPMHIIGIPTCNGQV